MKSKVFRLPKSKRITPSELLRQDGINGVLEDVIKDRPSIEGIVIITAHKNGTLKWKRSGLNDFEVIGILEQVKQWELDDTGEDDDV
jgi:hypothetical protein